jgi:hypothetical protein
MRRRRRLRTGSDRLWRCVMGRWGVPRGLVRPRVPLVLVRPRPQEIRTRPRSVPRPVDCRIALHLQMSWPAWLVEKPVRRVNQATTMARPAVSVTAPPPVAWQGPVRAMAERPVATHAGATPAAHPGADVPAPHHRGASVISASHRVFNRVETHEVVNIAPMTRQAVARLMPIPPTSIVASPDARRADANDGRRTVARSLRVPDTMWVQTDEVTHRMAARTAYEQPAQRTLLNQAPDRSSAPTPARSEGPGPTAPNRPPAAQPPLDISRLSDEVYRHIQRRVRIERERRGV